MFKRKIKITLLDFKWSVLKRSLLVNVIPRSGELIYDKELNQYYEVLNLVHDISNTNEIFVIVKEYDRTIEVDK